MKIRPGLGAPRLEEWYNSRTICLPTAVEGSWSAELGNPRDGRNGEPGCNYELR